MKYKCMLLYIVTRLSMCSACGVTSSIIYAHVTIYSHLVTGLSVFCLWCNKLYISMQNVPTHARACTHMQVYARTHPHTNPCMHTHVHTGEHTYTYIYTHTHTHTHTHNIYIFFYLYNTYAHCWCQCMSTACQ